MKYIDEERRKRMAAEWLSGLEVIRRVEAKNDKRPEGVGPEARALFIKANSEPALPVSIMNVQLGLSAEKSLKGRRELFAAAFAREQVMKGKGSGGSFKALEILPHGENELRVVHQLTPAKNLVTRSTSWKHGIGYPYLIKRKYEGEGKQVYFERKCGESFLDALVADREGVITGIEICLDARNSKGVVEYNVEKARKIVLGAPGLVHLKMAFEDSGVMRKVSTRLKKAERIVKERVTCISLGEFSPIRKA